MQIWVARMSSVQKPLGSRWTLQLMLCHSAEDAAAVVSRWTRCEVYSRVTIYKHEGLRYLFFSQSLVGLLCGLAWCYMFDICVLERIVCKLLYPPQKTHWHNLLPTRITKNQWRAACTRGVVRKSHKVRAEEQKRLSTSNHSTTNDYQRFQTSNIITKEKKVSNTSK